MERNSDNGCEIQDVCDGRSKVMIRLKLVKGSVDKELLANEDPGGLHGTRVMKKLVAPWRNSGRVVCADSYFAFVPFAIAISDMGMRFIGAVKTATKKYPQHYLSTVELPEKGDYKGVINIEPTTGYTLLAFVWVYRERRYFISNCCSLSQGLPYTQIRYRQIEEVATNIEPDQLEINIPQPKCVEEYYSCCAMIDRHNRSRQATLKTERKYGTHNWDMRVNLYIFSIIVVDTWCVVKGIFGSGLNDSKENLYTKLAEEMIESTTDEAQRTRGLTSNLRYTTWGISLLYTHEGRVSSGVGVHLTPTNKKVKNKGHCTNYMQQYWCSDCEGV